MNKIKNFLMKADEKRTVAIASITSAMAAIIGTTGMYAGTASNIVKSLLSYVFGIFFWIGVVLLAWGVGQLVLAFKNEDADSKSRAIMLIIASIVLMSVGTIFSGLGISGVGSVDTKTDF